MKNAKWFGLLVGATFACGGESSDATQLDTAEAISPSSSKTESKYDEAPSSSLPAPTATRVNVSIEPKVVAIPLHAEHRAIPGVMFGGWGPHLGHLLRRKTQGGTEAWFADDACTQGGAAACNVNVNHRIDYLRRDATGWKRVDSLSLPAGIQQNTGSVALGDAIFTYGIDSPGRSLWECARSFTTGKKSCSTISGAIGASANYIGAAVSPKGHRVVWYTNVADNSGGSFSYFVNYGQGWNGPRTGAIGGYNDSSYVNIGFGVNKNPDHFIMHSQLVGGLAPNWSFLAGVGEASLSGANAVAWATPFVAPMGDAVISTNDVLVDPDTADIHLLARTRSGSSAYYHRAAGKPTWSTPPVVFKDAARARLTMLGDGTIALIHSVPKQGVVIAFVGKEARVAGSPIAWDRAPRIPVEVPEGFKNIHAVYTESTVYQDAPVTSIDFALVGTTKESEVLSVSATIR